MSAATIDGNANGGVPAELLDLAPLNLLNHRADRYRAGNIAVALGDLMPADQAIIQRIYQQITHLLDILSAKAPARRISAAVSDFIANDDFAGLRVDLRGLGRATFAGREPDQEIFKAIHDIRGGALTALFFRLEMSDLRPLTKEELRTLFMLTRDHGKIMRSAIVDLDPVRRALDVAPQSHHVSLLLEKWQDATVGQLSAQHPVGFSVACRFDGAVSECCLESAAIDRIFYNLVANALRHNAGDRLELTIFEVPREPGQNLRFILRNALSDEDARRIRDLSVAGAAAQDLAALFQPGVSTTGSGLGLAIVADLVTQAFGIGSQEQALRLGYFGARILGGKFTAWFHWPIARAGLGRVVPRDAESEIPRDLQNVGR